MGDVLCFTVVPIAECTMIMYMDIYTYFHLDATHNLHRNTCCISEEYLGVFNHHLK